MAARCLSRRGKKKARTPSRISELIDDGGYGSEVLVEVKNKRCNAVPPHGAQLQLPDVWLHTQQQATLLFFG